MENAEGCHVNLIQEIHCWNKIKSPKLVFTSPKATTFVRLNGRVNEQMWYEQLFLN